MARRRMFSLDVTDTDLFLEMPASAQALYFHLGMHGDDDGFVSSPNKIMKNVNCSSDDMKILLAKGFVIPFDTGICVIRHWRIHNYIQSDRYHATRYVDEKKCLTIQDDVYNLDTNRIQSVPKLDTEVRLGKDSIGKDKEEVALPAEAVALSRLLYILHHDNIDIGYNVSEASLSKWATSIEKINRLDSRSWADIESAIRWIKTPGQFWAANIMSGAKLREKFPTIWGQMKRGNGQSPRVNQRTAFLDMEE